MQIIISEEPRVIEKKVTKVIEETIQPTIGKRNIN